MDWTSILSALLILFAGGLLQGTVGFGLGLFCVPLLLTAGFPVSTVLAMASIGTAVQAVSGVHHLRHAVPWRTVGFSLLIRAAAMAAGVGLVRVLAGYPVASLKFWVGAVMLALVAAQAWWRPMPRPKLHAAWDWAAFLGSGFTAGLCSMGGPPLVLWVMAHDWPADRTRGFLFASFMSLVPLQLVLLYSQFGQDVLRGALLGLALAPAVLAGSLAGLRVGGRFSKTILRRVAYTVLLAIAFNAMYPQARAWFRSVVPPETHHSSKQQGNGPASGEDSGSAP
jgi:hypothetical protein